MVFNTANILIPKTNLTKWSVVACDQYTSEADYWNEVKKNTGDDASSLNIIYPEIYLCSVVFVFASLFTPSKKVEIAEGGDGNEQ